MIPVWGVRAGSRKLYESSFDPGEDDGLLQQHLSLFLKTCSAVTGEEITMVGTLSSLRNMMDPYFWECFQRNGEAICLVDAGSL